MTRRKYETFGASEFDLNNYRAGAMKLGDRFRHPQYGVLTLAKDPLFTSMGQSVEFRTEELDFPIYSAKAKRWEKVHD